MNMNWKELIRNIAPTIGASLGGPAAGLGIKYLADKFLGKPDATEQELADAVLGATPEQLLTIKKLDADFKIQMRQLDIDVFKLEAQDRDSARKLATVNMVPHIVLTFLYTIGYFLVLYFFMTGKVKVDSDIADTFNQIVGVLTAAQITIMAFWFGSSYGSKVKDAK